MEPNAAVAQQVQAALWPYGYEVHIAADGPTGLHMASQTPYDLLAIHHNLAGQDGLTVLNQLRQRGHLPATIILAQPGQEAFTVEAMRLGAGDYLIQDAEGRYLALWPIVVERLLARQRLEHDKQQMLTILQGRNRALALLNQISYELTSIHDPDEVVERILAATVDIMGAQGCSLWLWENEQQHTLVCQAVFDQVVSPPLKGVRVTAGQGVVGWVAANNRSAVVQQTTDDVRFLAEIDVKINFQTQSLMAVPMRMRDEVLGVLEVVNKFEGAFNQDDLNVAKTLASSAATAIENARLVRALRQYTTDLEERNAELDAFAHTVAHDIQNMLARIMGFAELLRGDVQDEARPLVREELRQPVEFIATNSRRMSKVVEALLLLAAVRQTEVSASPLDMGAILREVLDRLNDQIMADGAQITLPEQWPVAYGYAPWVEEIWFNYVSNALKYGGVPPVLTLGAEYVAEEAAVRFCVQDCGPGIDPAHQGQLFQPFSRIGQRRRHGYGLGLSIVERIVTKMGGRVGVVSDVGAGSQFFFTLPAVQKP